MENYVVFIFSQWQKIEKVENLNPQVIINKFFQKKIIDGVETPIYKLGEWYLQIKHVNCSIVVKNRNYKVIELIPIGYTFQVKTYDITHDGETPIEMIDQSGTFSTFNECYDEMKMYAVKDMANDIDVEQDFESGDIFKRNISFAKNKITWTDGGKVMIYEVVKY
jgi:hypothetical protein